jgi:hypothetical protein
MSSKKCRILNRETKLINYLILKGFLQKIQPVILTLAQQARPQKSYQYRKWRHHTRWTVDNSFFT